MRIWLLLEVGWHLLFLTPAGLWLLRLGEAQRRQPTDATFLWPADRKKSGWSRVLGWQRMAGWRRGLYLDAAVQGAAHWVWVATYRPELARNIELTVRVLLAAAVLVGSGVGQRLARHWWRWTRPVATTMRANLRWGIAVKPSRIVTVPLNWATEPQARAKLWIAPTFEVSKINLEHTVDIAEGAFGGKLDSEYVPGRHKHLLVWRHAAPPAHVPVPDVLPLIARAPRQHLLVGLAANDEPVWWPYGGEFAHLLFSVPTRGGKSTTVAGLAAQALSPAVDADVVVLDPKRWSQTALRDHPNVRYYRRNRAEIIQGIQYLNAELETRNAHLDDIGYDPETQPLPYREIFVIIEELGALSAWLTAGRRRNDTAASAAVNHLRDLAFMGAAPGIHLIAITQRGDAATLGGGNIRDNYGARIARSPSSFELLGQDVENRPIPIIRPGSASLILGDQQTQFQAPHWHRPDLQALAANQPHTQTATTTPQPPNPPTTPRNTDVESAEQAFGFGSDVDTGVSGFGGLRLVRGGLADGPGPDGPGCAVPVPEPVPVEEGEWRPVTEWWDAGLIPHKPGSDSSAVWARLGRARKRGTLPQRPAGWVRPRNNRATELWSRLEVEAWNAAEEAWLHRPEGVETVTPARLPAGIPGGGSAGIPAGEAPVRLPDPGPAVLTLPRSLLTSTERGYDEAHKAERAARQAALKAGDRCARDALGECVDPTGAVFTRYWLTEGRRLLQLDHRDDRSGWLDGLAHPRCNAAAGGRLGAVKKAGYAAQQGRRRVVRVTAGRSRRR